MVASFVQSRVSNAANEEAADAAAPAKDAPPQRMIIRSENIGSQEVTQEYVGLESQLRNLEAAEIELRQLMTTIRVRSKKASEMLEMYQQLSTIGGQIDQIKGRMRYLSQMRAFASLQVDLVPNALASRWSSPDGSRS